MMPDTKTQILIVFANPIDSGLLRLGAEDRIIKESLSQSIYSEQIAVDTCHASSLHDMRRSLLRKEYRILQFSGHSDSSGFLFENRDGTAQRVGFEVFTSFLLAYSPPLECVILNACSTLEQGKFLAFNVPFVIAMKAPIGDSLAIEFSRGFYEAIAAGKDIEFAFQEGRRCVKAIAQSQADLPVLIKSGVLARYSLQPQGIRQEQYNGWYDRLSHGELEVKLTPSAYNEVNILLSIIKKVLTENEFSDNTIKRTAIIYRELINNVARHLKNSPAIVGIGINPSHLPLVVISVADRGQGFNLLTTIRQQTLELKSGEPEHGIGRVCRLSDNVQAEFPSSSNPFFTIFCTLYDLTDNASIADDFAWCSKIIINYDQPPDSVWFGDERYALWKYPYWEQGIGWTVLSALLLAKNHNVQELLEIYLGHLLAAKPRYILLESRGHGPTEPAPHSSGIIISALEMYLAEYFEDKRVILFQNKSAGYLSAVRDKYDLELVLSEKECYERLKSLEHSSQSA